MRPISDTIQRLSAWSANHPISAGVQSDILQDLVEFGSNPGALRGRLYAPASLSARAPLVVVLHGCMQSAASYDRGVGWSRLADQNDFALLYPEQQRANNPNLCFNWFLPGDNGRDRGEALSIRQMIEAAIVTHSLDDRRVFISGLSAGGAMANVMLATYPEIFAGGAIIAGLPYGCASSVPQAFDRMRGHGSPNSSALRRYLIDASSNSGPWPRISVWHGTADHTVVFSNAQLIVDQWSSVHGVRAGAPRVVEEVDGSRRRAWADAGGQEVIEEFIIEGMGHGTPIAADGPQGLGIGGPFILDVGISSTLHSARAWGLLSGGGAEKRIRRDGGLRPERSDSERPSVGERKTLAALEGDRSQEETKFHDGEATEGKGGGIRKTIEDALRAAGLMR